MDSHTQDPLFERLAGCFQKIFPGLEREKMLGATHDNVAGWGSLQQVTLLSLMEEEFGLDIDLEEIETASFADMLELVGSRRSNG